MMRMGTAGGARSGTGAAGYQFMGAMGPLADVNIADRPVTQQGLMGLRPATSGPGRQVQDASYFLGLLRSKINETAGQITKMKGDIERIGKESAIMTQLDKKYDALIKEVRSLEGDLADYNLALDKSRTSVDATEIQQYHQALKRRNEGTSREVDAVFVERQERERGVARLEDKMREIQAAAEARINALPPPQVAEYRALMDENKSLSQEIQKYQSDLEATNQQIDSLENELRRDRVRDEYAILEKRLVHLRREQAALEEDLALTRLDPSQARDRLLAKVKDDNARNQGLERELAEVEAANAQRRKALEELVAEIEERRGSSGAGASDEQAKYELLFKRDQEMTEFIDRFPDVRDKELSEQRRMQNTIVALLEHMSEGMARETSMPSAAQAEEMKEDLSDKAREAKAAQTTHERLRDELQLRQTELEKISSLDVRIAEELRTITERMAMMRGDMAKLADIDGLRRSAEVARGVLAGKAKEYARRRDALRTQVASLAAESEKRKALAARDPQIQALEGIETKLKAHEQAVFALKESVASRAKETDYESLQKDALQTVAELNLMIQKAQLLGPTFIP